MEERTSSRMRRDSIQDTSTLSMVMPGSFASDLYRSDHPLPPKLDFSIGASSRIFQPPGTPSASSSLHQSTTGLNMDEGGSLRGTSRKRARRDEGTRNATTTGSDLGESWSFTATPTDFGMARSGGLASPMPFVSTRYQLEGGLDTPTTAATARFEQDSYSRTEMDDSQRRGYTSNRVDHPATLDRETQLSRGLMRERNGRPMLTPTPTHPSRKGWGKAVYRLVEGVAGKVWQLCRETTFGGFYAGGGPGYRLTPMEPVDGTGSVWQDGGQSQSFDFVDHGISTPVPGEFHTSRPLDDDDAERVSPRPAKKIQRDKGQGELREPWVMVSANTTPQLRELSPSRNNMSRKSASAASGRPLHGTPVRASPGRSGKRSAATPTRASQGPLSGSPALRAGQAASYASPRSPSASPRKKTSLAAAAGDPQKFAAKRRREEKQVNASMEKLNDQLRAMIREGKEALGTTVEVEDGGDGVVVVDDHFGT